MNLNKQHTPLLELKYSLFEDKGVELYVKRDDLIDPDISGNKWRKLKYNLLEAKNKSHTTILTFGGAYSNHIYAVAGAGKKYGFKTIGIIRGEEHLPLNSTLSYAKDCGMEFHYVSRDDYKLKSAPEFEEELRNRFGSFYSIPEGGTNALAVKGCEEIVQEVEVEFDYICCACGTGGTVSGLINSVTDSQKVLGFPALKGGDFLKEDIDKFLIKKEADWNLVTDYHFGGYAKVKPDLIEFMAWFHSEFGIKLDPVYTGKLFFGLFDLIKNDYFKQGDKISAVHTGGLQGLNGMKERGLIK